MMKKIFRILGAVALVAVMVCNVAVTQISSEEIEEWRAQAAQGDARAQFILGAAYYYGEGVAQDKREAYIWYSIAKANGNELAADKLRKINWRNYLS